MVNRLPSPGGCLPFRHLGEHPRAPGQRYSAPPRGISGRFGRDLRGGGGASEGYPVGRAPHPRRALVEDVSVDHRGANTPVAKPLLDGADVVAGLWATAKGAGNRRPSWLTSDHYFEAELERPV